MQNRFPMIFAFALGSLLAISKGVRAEIPEQNEMWLAQQAAQNVLLAGDCAKTTIKRLQKFKLVETKDGIQMNGADYLVYCTEKKIVVVPKNQANLSWDTPVKKEDGTEFKKEELAGYYLYHNDSQIKLGGVNSLSIPDLPVGTHKFYIQAIDKNGLVSKNSNTVELKI